MLRFDGQAVDQSSMDRMLQRLAHRGHDHSGLVMNDELSSSANIAIGHRRLSIIDLSDDASQPMAYDDGKLWITFNGEIYNYLELREELSDLGFFFETQSDTEVILAAYSHWGKDCVHHLNGMFAFALWDESAEELFCARDELGIKPFYYYKTSAFIVFASESKALTDSHQNRLNLESVSSYMLSLYIPSDWSVFEGVKKLLPAHTMTVSKDGSLDIERYWSVSQFYDIELNTASKNKMESCLQSAIEQQLRSDVPVGGLLSGGVDSGLIVAIASKIKPDLHTYSVGFEGMEVNELPTAAEIAKKYNTNHHECLISNQDAMQALDSAIQSLSEPLADPALVPSFVLAKMAAEDGVKVLLSGSGGDEVFGGYTRYVHDGSLKRRLLGWLPEGARAYLGGFLSSSSKLSVRLKNIYLDMMLNTSGNFDLCSLAMGSPDKLTEMLNALAASFPLTLMAQNQPLVYKQMLFDKSVYLPDDLLLLLDQMGMAHTVEGRVPLIDKRVVEMSFRFPICSHVNGRKTKKMFRDIAESYLGHEHVWRKKQGFAGPVPWWVNQHRTVFLEAAASVREISPLQHMDVSGLLNRAHKEKNICLVDAHALFILYCFRRWYDSL